MVYGPSGIFSVLLPVAKKHCLSEGHEIIDPLIEKEIISENMYALSQYIEASLEITEIIRTNT